MSVKITVPQGNAFSEKKQALLNKWRRGLNQPDVSLALSQEGEFPLSFAQQRLWFIEQFLPETSLYAMPFAVKISGQLDVDILQKAINIIIERHASLRTYFIIIDGQPKQKIIEKVSINIAKIDLSHLTENTKENEYIAILTREARKVFDLSKPPLLRSLLITLNHNQFVFFINFHHLIADGWSLAIFQKELAFCYQSIKENKTILLPSLKIQYLDYIKWQENLISSEKYALQLKFWEKKLANFKTKNIIAADKLVERRTYQGKRYYIEFSEEITRKLYDLVIKTESTLYIVILTALKTLLFRYSGENDLAIGCPIANRNELKFSGLIGFFVNMIVIRTLIDGQKSFKENIDKIKRETFSAYANQDLPFELLVKTLQIGREINVSSPLFQIGFVLQNIPQSENKLLDLTLDPIPIHNGTAQFDLLLSLVDMNKKIIGFFEYASELYEESTIQKLSNQFIKLIEEVVDQPEQMVDEVSLINDCEKNEIISWSTAKNSFPVNYCIHQYFEHSVINNADAIAISYNDENISYRQLNERANQLAYYLQRLDIQSETLIGICLARNSFVPIAIVAILKLGCAYVPIDPENPVDRISFIISDINLKFVVTEKNQIDKFADSINLITIDTLQSLLKTESTENLNLELRPNILSYIIYTSGSTGKPKGVMIEHKNVLRLFFSTNDLFKFSNKDVWALFHSYAFDFSVWELWGALLYGGRIVIISQMLARSPEDFYQTLNKENITVLCQTPSAFKQLIAIDAANKNFKLQNLRLIIFGGEMLNLLTLQPWINKYGDNFPKLVNMYGITETTVHVTFKQITKQDINRPSVIGMPISDLSCYLLDEKRKIVPLGFLGEIYIGGAGVARGYYNRPELTNERFIANPFTIDGSKLYRTGDSGRITANGDLVYLGRLDQQIKIRGFRIEIGEIEFVLKQHPHVADAFVRSDDKSSHDVQLVAYIITKAATDTDRFEIDTQLKNQWTSVFNQNYQNSDTQYPFDFNIIGWNSLYTGEPIAVVEMKEWVDHTIEQILKYKPEHILEIGCGTGLLLFKLRPYFKSYLGLDFSEEAINYLKNLIDPAENIHLRQQSAEDLSSVNDKFYDTIIINSVIQYFPSAEYLINVIENSLKKIKEGGVIYIGDVRSLPLLNIFYQDIENYNAAYPLSLTELQTRVDNRIIEEHELIIDPKFFYALKEIYSEITDVKVILKKGSCANELNRFRYDVIIKTGKIKIIDNIPSIEWKDENSLNEIELFLTNENPNFLFIKKIPNARLKNFYPYIINNAIDPQELIKKLEKYNYTSELKWAGPELDEMFDLVLFKNFDPKYNFSVIDVKLSHSSPLQYTNQPHNNTLAKKIIVDLRKFCKERMPEYMIPSIFMTLEKFPLTTNGKIDINSLPLPRNTRTCIDIEYVRYRNDVEKRLVELWQEILGLSQIGIKDSFFELGGHSLLAVQLIFQIQEIFSVKIPLRIVFEKPNIEWLAFVIESYLNGSKEKLINTIDFYQEAKIILNKSNLSNQATFPDTVLVTGVTGFFGAFLLRELLTSYSTKVVCLIRGKNFNEAINRLKINLLKFGINVPNLNERIEVVVGDLTKPMLGLNEQEFNRLADKINIIYHNASLVNFIAPYQEHKDHNVLGTHEIIKLANTGINKEIHYISTTHVFSVEDAIENRFLEIQLPSHPETLHSGYTQSKWVAEKMIFNAIEQGLKAYIYRLGRIWGDELTGHCQQNDFLWLVIKACLNLKLAPQLSTVVDIVPADYASKAIVALAKTSYKESKAFHLVNPNPTPWDQAIMFIRDKGYTIDWSPYQQWQAKLTQFMANHPNDPINGIVPLLDEDWDVNSSIHLTVDYHHCEKLLKKFGLNCPYLNKELMNCYLAYFEKIKYL